MPILGITASSISGSVSSSFEPIATLQGNGSSTSLTFSSIPQTYQHLQLRSFVRQTGGSGTTAVWLSSYVNGSTTASDYTLHGFKSNGSAVQSNWGFTANGEINHYYVTGNSALANAFGAGITDIHNYSSSSYKKTFRSIGGNNVNGSGTASGNIFITSGLYNQTTAITSLELHLSSSLAFDVDSVFSLYGIKGA